MEYKFFKPILLKCNNLQVTLRRYSRYYLRKIIFYQYVIQFEEFVNSNPLLQDFFEHSPICAYVLIRYFCNRSFNSAERFNHIVSDLKFMAKLHLSSKILPLWREKILLFNIDGEKSYGLFLEKNTIANEEGFWALVLRNSLQERIYQATFSFTSDNDLLIASIQGSKSCQNEDDEIKFLTKKCFGLRPASLLIEVLKIFTRVVNCNATLGIPSKFQIRSNKGFYKGYYVDYDKIWQESCGEIVKIHRHYYYLLNHTHKKLEDVPSKKRSMYKSRFAMLEEIQDKIDRIFRAK